jgi:hypothetical protein
LESNQTNEVQSENTNNIENKGEMQFQVKRSAPDLTEIKPDETIEENEEIYEVRRD